MEMFSRYQVPTQDEPKQLRSTQSYIYYTDDKRGEGATGSVFGGREKKSGEKVAVKVFNNLSRRRPGSVQEREFDVLLKLNHPNIVKLLAIEDDAISHDRVIVMELCTGGSLFNVLDRPENSFGLAETEFLILLGDVSQGMKHLQDKGIVHRDLKPGNIMCCFGPDGCSVYKLADFGAARELAEGENFVSIYGTEEYLHPDVYERAVLRKPLQRPFTASVDLWSIGVTLSHAATGMLPFRPYGGRRNRTTMHQMTTLKASGIISGVQRGSENGPIDWSRELPKTTQLSQGLRHYVEEMLAGLLESDVNKMWSFQTFFRTAQSIVNKTVVDVFYVVTSQLLKVYIDPTYSFAEFQEYVAMQTSLQSAHQMHVFEDAIFYPDSTVPCRSFPETSPANPIMLFKRTFDGAVSPVTPVAPHVPTVQTKYSLRTDAPATKRSIAALFCLKRKQEKMLLMQSLQDKAVKAFTYVMKDEGKLLSFHLGRLETPNKTLPSSLENTHRLIRTQLQLKTAYLSLANGNRIELDRVYDLLEILSDEVALKIEDIHQLSMRCAEVAKQLNFVNQPLLEQDALRKSWAIQSQCRTKDKCVERFDVMFFSLLEIYSNFCRDGMETSLEFNLEQIHKMEKIKFNELIPQIVSLVRDHCESNWLSKHSEMMEWFSLAYSLREQIKEVDEELSPLVSDFSTEESVVEKLVERCRETVDSSTKEILSLLKAPARLDNHTSIDFPSVRHTGVGPISSNYQDRSPHAESTSVSLQTSLPHPWDTRQCTCVSKERTPDDEGTADIGELSADKELGGACATDGEGLTGHVDTGSGSRVVAVPPDLKRGIEEWNKEKKAEEMVKESQHVAEKFRNISMNLNDSLDMYGAGN